MTSIKVEDMLFNLKKECTMVVAVHTPQMAGRIAEETAMMEDGTVLEPHQRPVLPSAASAHRAVCQREVCLIIKR